MKKALFVAVCALFPLGASAAPFEVESLFATSTTATSTFAGNIESEGDVRFGFASGLISLIEGYINLVASDGGSTEDGASISLQAGTGGSTSGSAGSVALIAGDAGGDEIRGGDVILSPGVGGAGGPTGRIFIPWIDYANPREFKVGDVSTINKDGNSFNFIGSDGWGQSNGGGLFFYAGAGGDTGSSGGHIEFLSGEGGSAFGDGGNFIVRAGSAQGEESKGGDVLIASGDAHSSNLPGSITLLSEGDIFLTKGFGLGAATTTVTFGELGEPTSKACFNTKNTDGDDISFYFVGTSMVVESNTCQ